MSIRSDKENTKPHALHSAEGQIQPAVTAYTYAPGVVGLKGWLAPGVHMLSPIVASAGLNNGHAKNNSGNMAYAHSSRTIGRKKQDSPLRVRKTRENLRQANDIPNTPGRLSLVSKSSSKDGTTAAKMSWNEDKLILDTISIENYAPLQVAASDMQHESSSNPIANPVVVGASCSSSSSGSKLSMQLEVAEPIQRRKSVRKRVVSKMKEGILSRSRSTNKILDMVHSGPITERSNCDHAGVVFVRHAEQLDRAVMSPASENHLLQGCDNAGTTDMPPLPRKFDAVSTTVNDTLGSSQSKLKHGSTSTLSISPHSLSPEHTPRPARKPEATPDDYATVASAGALQIRISTTPTLATLDITDSKTIWVMVKVEAVIPATTMTTDNVVCKHSPDSEANFRTQRPTSSSLDMIVVIDNSSVIFLVNR